MRARLSPWPDLLRRFRDDAGAVAVMVAILTTVLLGSAALAVDMGALYSQRRQLQTTADAAVLAGVRELPVNPSSAVAVAQQYITANGPFADDVEIVVRRTYVNNDTIAVVVQQTESPHFFARIFGSDSSPVSARAAAIAGSPTTYNSGVMPFSILAHEWEPTYGYARNQLFDLIVSTENSTKGNYNWLNLGAYSAAGEASPQKIMEAGGTSLPISIGSIAPSSPGNSAVPLYRALTDHLTRNGAGCAPHLLNDPVSGLRRNSASNLYEPRHLDGTVCNRLIITPVVVINEGDPFDWENMSGAKKLRVIAFASIFVANNPNGKDGSIIGQFVQTVPRESVSPGAYIEYAGLMTWLIE